MPSITQELTNKQNKAYAEAIKKQLLQLPTIAAKAATKSVYAAAVRYTVQDSGLAAYNWWIAVGGDGTRHYHSEKGVGPIGYSGSRRSTGKGDARVSGSPEAVVSNKINYMNKVLTGQSEEFFRGAVIYNMTPESNESTFKGSYTDNAKIRAAVEMGIQEAESAVRYALRSINFGVK